MTILRVMSGTAVIIGTGKGFIGKPSARQGWGRFWHIRKHSFGVVFLLCIMYNCGKCQDYKEWLSTKLAVLLGARKGSLGKL